MFTPFSHKVHKEIYIKIFKFKFQHKNINIFIEYNDDQLFNGRDTSVSKTMGSYTVSVKHSSKSLVSDAIVTMRDDQKDKLLQLKEGDPIKYTAKLTRYGDILGIYAEDGT